MGPYVALNSDSDIYQHAIDNDTDGFKSYLKPGDVQVLDRGFYLVLAALIALGIVPWSPAFIPKGVSI